MRLEYDGEASARHLMAVVHEVDDALARRILALHRECGSGTGVCDSDLEGVPDAERVGWGCETSRVIAQHFGLARPLRGSESA